MTIGREDIITVGVGIPSLHRCARMARLAEIGGSSNIREEGERAGMLSMDQLVGQIGTFAGSRWLTGSETPYFVSRWYANHNPTVGDGGCDVPGCNVDFKTSLMRASRDPLEYRLPVRPKERHEGWVYVLVLVESLDPSLSKPVTVHLVGWAKDGGLPAAPEAGGVFSGAFVVKAADLNPLPPVRWLYHDVPKAVDLRRNGL